MQQPKVPFKLNQYHYALRSAFGLFIGASLLTTSTPSLAEEISLELGDIDVIETQVSDTKPIQGYKATRSTNATRTDTPLVDVPQSITVITEDAVKDISVQSITQAVEYVPGVQGAAGEGNRDAIVFRGNETTSDLYVDGIRDDVQIFRDLYNTQQLEVVKGANGMVSGRGGAGGIINRVTKEAGWDPIKELRLSYGAYNQKRAQIDLGQGITDDIAFRLNAVYENSDSYRAGVDLKRYGINPTITIKPDDATKITFGLEYFKDERIGDRGFPSVQGADGTELNNRPYNLEDYSLFFGNAALSPNASEVSSFNAMIEHQFDNGLKVRNRARFANYNKFYQNFYAGSSVAANGDLTIKSYRDETNRENFTNQTDFIYKLNTGSIEHQLLAGLEYTTQDSDNRRLKSDTSSFTVNVSNPFVPASSVGPITNIDRNQAVNVDTLGVFLQDQIQLTEKLQAIVGVRYDNVEIDYNDIKNGETADIDDDLVSPRAGIIYKPMPAMSVYANYSLTKVPRAGDQLISLRGNIDNAAFAPEKFVNKEIGAKWDITTKLAFNAAVYKLERQNVVTNDPNDAALTILVDGQETKGLELSLSGQVTHNWSTIAALTLQDGKLTEAVDGSPEGAQLANTPDRSLSLWNKYQINDIWSVALGVISVSNRLSAVETTTATSIMPGYTRYDAAVFADFSDQLRLQLNVENLTDKAYALYGHNTNNITPGAPLTGRATLIYNF